MPDFSAFEKSTQDRTSRAAQMRRDLLLPILDANGSFRSDISREELNTTFKTASQNSVYESAGEQAPMIMGIHARALKNFSTAEPSPPMNFWPAPTKPLKTS